MNDLGLVKPVDGLGQGVVLAVADTADQGFDAGFGETLGVFDRDILAAPIAVVDEPTAVAGASVMESLLQSIEDEAGMGPCGWRATQRCAGRRYR